jgi:hypothetical protein
MQRKTVEPMQVIYATQQLTIPEVGSYAKLYCAKIIEETEEYGLRIVGPWVFVACDLPRNGRQRYKVDFCLPIENGEAYTGNNFAVKNLEPLVCAFTEYRGKLRQLFSKGYQPLVREIVAAKMKFTGESREVYHVWVDSASPDNRIEIQFGVV